MNLLVVLLLCAAAYAQFDIQPPPKFQDRNPFELSYSEKQPRNAKFLMLTVATAGVVAVDLQSTLASGGEETMSPWLYGNFPYKHPARVSAIMFGEFGAATALGYFLRERHSRFWWVPQTVLIATHGVGVIHNFRLGLY